MRNIITKLELIALHIRLWRIEKALGIRLRPEQRACALHAQNDILVGGRRNGKTVAANVKTILIRRQPLEYDRMRVLDYRGGSKKEFFCHYDPDWYKNTRWHIEELARCVQACYNAGIKTFRMEVKPGVWIGGKPKFHIFRRRSNK